MNTPSLKGQIHEEIEKIFRTLLPQNGLAVREEQIALCHIMLDALLKNNIALCDAGVGIGKTYAYLTGCILLRKNTPHSAVSSLPVLVSTSSIALQDAIIEEYIPFYPVFFWKIKSFKSLSEPSYAKAKNGLYAMSASLSGWKP